MSATGQSAGQSPVPYWLTYMLETDETGATTSLQVAATVEQNVQRLDLRRDSSGWTVDGERRPDLDSALDCDLEASPVTNTMPILRHGLHRRAGAQEFIMAFVAVPSLEVSAMEQHYQHLGAAESGSLVRFSSGAFRSDLLVDEHGVVVDYPTMAHRVPAG